MPIPILGAVGIVGKLFGGVVKKIRSSRQVKKAKKAEAKAKILAAKSVLQINTAGQKLFSITGDEMTPAQSAVFNSPTQENIVPSDNRAQSMAPDMLKKYGVYLLAGIVILILFKFIKK